MLILSFKIGLIILYLSNYLITSLPFLLIYLLFLEYFIKILLGGEYKVNIITEKF